MLKRYRTLALKANNPFNHMHKYAGVVKRISTGKAALFRK